MENSSINKESKLEFNYIVDLKNDINQIIIKLPYANIEVKNTNENNIKIEGVVFSRESKYSLKKRLIQKLIVKQTKKIVTLKLSSLKCLISKFDENINVPKVKMTISFPKHLKLYTKITNGYINVHGMVSRLKVKSINANTNVCAAIEELYVSTVNGNVDTITNSNQKSWSLKTINGDVVVKLTNLTDPFIIYSLLNGKFINNTPSLKYKNFAMKRKNGSANVKNTKVLYIKSINGNLNII